MFQTSHKTTLLARKKKIWQHLKKLKTCTDVRRQNAGEDSVRALSIYLYEMAYCTYDIKLQ